MPFHIKQRQFKLYFVLYYAHNPQKEDEKDFIEEMKQKAPYFNGQRQDGFDLEDIVAIGSQALV